MSQTQDVLVGNAQENRITGQIPESLDKIRQRAEFGQKTYKLEDHASGKAFIGQIFSAR